MGTAIGVGTPSGLLLAEPGNASETVDWLSLTSLYLKLWGEGDKQLGTATGFIVRRSGRHFLVTNWHVLSGRRTDNGQPCHSSMALPRQVRIAHHKNEPGHWQFVGELLNDEAGNPRWVEHPRGPAVDVAVLELSKLPRDGRIYALDVEQLADVELATPPGTAVSVIGFPLGLRENAFLGIWKTGHIASDVHIRDDNFLIDATTKKGMSGSPVIARRWVNEPAEVTPGVPGVLLGQAGRSPMVYVESTLATKFLGIYSGRIHEDVEIGYVWRPSVIREVLDRAVGAG